MRCTNGDSGASDPPIGSGIEEENGWMQAYRQSLDCFLPVWDDQMVPGEECEIVREDAENQCGNQKLQNAHEGRDTPRHQRKSRHAGNS